MPLRTLCATRYVTPLREGGSLPAIVEAEDDGLYVLKFRGAGQGPKALVAELLAGEIARAAGLAVPEIVLLELDADLARSEPDPEIQDLIRASAGVNLGARLSCPARSTFDPVADRPDAALASAHRLVRRVGQQRRPHGAQHEHADVAPAAVADRPRRGAVLPPRDGATTRRGSATRSRRIRDHVLLPLRERAARRPTRACRRADARRSWARSSPACPTPGSPATALCADPAARRAAYVDYLVRRLQAPRAFVEEAIRAHALHV